MKKILLSLAALMLVFGLAVSANAVMIEGDPFEGDSWGQAFKTDYKPNLVNLWSTHPFQSAPLPGGWTYWQSDDGYWAQWFTTGDYNVSNITATQYWVDSKPSELYLDWQEVWYDWDTGTIVQSWSGGLKGYWSVVPYGYAGGPDYCPSPVPEPATMLLLGTGLIGLACLGRKKFLRSKGLSG